MPCWKYKSMLLAQLVTLWLGQGIYAAEQASTTTGEKVKRFLMDSLDEELPPLDTQPISQEEASKRASVDGKSSKSSSNLRGDSQEDVGAENRGKRPMAVLNVGPRKTGTTAIQSALKKSIDEFDMDNYVVIPKYFHEVAPCLAFRRTDTTWEERCQAEDYGAFVEKYTSQALAEGKNIIYSSEVMDRVKDMDIGKLLELFDGFDIHVVITYRRFFEWAVSFYGQLYRHGIGWMDWDTVATGKKRSLIDYYSLDEVTHLDAIHYATHVLEFYEAADGIETHVINFHAQDDIVSEFFCLPVLQAPHACEAAKKAFAERDTSNDTRSNAGSSIEFDRIALAAMQEGYLDPTTISRPDARAEIERFMQDTLHVKESELPKECLDTEVLDFMRSYSLESEALLFPEFHASEEGAKALLQKFESYRYTSFCTVDPTRVLESPDLLAFLESLADLESN